MSLPETGHKYFSKKRIKCGRWRMKYIDIFALGFLICANLFLKSLVNDRCCLLSFFFSLVKGQQRWQCNNNTIGFSLRLFHIPLSLSLRMKNAFQRILSAKLIASEGGGEISMQFRSKNGKYDAWNGKWRTTIWTRYEFHCTISIDKNVYLKKIEKHKLDRGYNGKGRDKKLVCSVIYKGAKNRTHARLFLCKQTQTEF